MRKNLFGLNLDESAFEKDPLTWPKQFWPDDAVKVDTDRVLRMLGDDSVAKRCLSCRFLSQCATYSEYQRLLDGQGMNMVGKALGKALEQKASLLASKNADEMSRLIRFRLPTAVAEGLGQIDWAEMIADGLELDRQRRSEAFWKWLWSFVTSPFRFAAWLFKWAWKILWGIVLAFFLTILAAAVFALWIVSLPFQFLYGLLFPRVTTRWLDEQHEVFVAQKRAELEKEWHGDVPRWIRSEFDGEMADAKNMHGVVVALDWGRRLGLSVRKLLRLRDAVDANGNEGAVTENATSNSVDETDF